MRYTNKFGLSRYVCDWLKKDDYDYNNTPGVYSATTLLKPARAVYLERSKPEELEIDVSDMIAARIGTAIHASFEAAEVGDRREERLQAEVKSTKGTIYTITGKFDMIVDNRLIDIKTTSTWKYIFREYQDYIQQLSIYRYLLNRNGTDVEKNATILFYFTDWSRSKAKRDGTYPQGKLLEEPITLLDIPEAENLIRENLDRFEIFKERYLLTGEMPECTPEELWQSKTVYALKKKGRQSAVKLYYNENEAIAAVSDEKTYYVETRPGKVKRCAYCNARLVCEQYWKLLENDAVDA